MGYYAGDFYEGSKGDPGLRSLLSFGLSHIPIVGPTLGRIAGSLGGSGRAATAGRSLMRGVGGAIMKHPVLTAGGAAGVGVLAGAGAEHALMAPGAACPKGFHPCKNKRHGCKKGPCVRNRRMNVTNPRALRRSLRRAHGFARVAMRTIHLIHPRKKGRFGGFKKRKKH